MISPTDVQTADLTAIPSLSGQFDPDPWEPPLPLDGPPVDPLPTDALPAWLRDFVLAEAEATQTPPDLAAVLALAVLSAACSRSVEISPWGDWREPINLFAMVVLPSGHRKSAVFGHVVQPLFDWEYDADPRRALDDLPTKPPTFADALDRMIIRGAPRPRLVVDDCTPERLTQFLHESNGRIALLSPTGGVFDFMAGRYGNRNPALDPYIKGYDGRPIVVERKGSPPELIDRPAITIGVAAPPDVLRGLMAGRLFRIRGLPARFLYAMPASTIGRRATNPPPVPPDLRAHYERCVRVLLDRFRAAAEPTLVPLADSAAERLRQFSERLEPRLAHDGDLADLVEWAANLPALVVRLAGLLHLAARADQSPPALPADPIDDDTLRAACTLGSYAIPHARAAYAAAGDDPFDDARFVLRAIIALDRDEVTHQRIWQATKSRFRHAAALNAALATLIAHRYLRACPGPERTHFDGTAVRGRKPAPSYRLNPLTIPRPQSPLPLGEG